MIRSKSGKSGVYRVMRNLSLNSPRKRTIDGNLLNVGAVFVHAPDARTRTSIRYQDSLIPQRTKIAKAQYEVLFLEAPADTALPEPVELVVAVPEPSPVLKQTVAPSFDTLVWAPVPGITALKSNNKAGFATAVGIVGAGTAATVALTGHATYSATQMAGMSALTSYGLTVLVNHMFLSE